LVRIAARIMASQRRRFCFTHFQPRLKTGECNLMPSEAVSAAAVPVRYSLRQQERAEPRTDSDRKSVKGRYLALARAIGGKTALTPLPRGCDGIAHFPAVAGGLVDAAMPLIGRGRSAAWAGCSGRGQDAAATRRRTRTQAVLDKTHCSKARSLRELSAKPAGEISRSWQSFREHEHKQLPQIKANTSDSALLEPPGLSIERSQALGRPSSPRGHFVKLLGRSCTKICNNNNKFLLARGANQLLAIG
jgi:hypothetical protein